ncbi:MAG TPA: hypothetical protein VF550_12455 [Polyangia bacterium]
MSADADKRSQAGSSTILGTATAVPEHCFDQDSVKRQLRPLLPVSAQLCAQTFRRKAYATAMAMLRREDHGLHSGDLDDGELARVGAGTRRAIIEGAGCRGMAPGMVTSWFEAENPEDQAKGEPRPGALDGTEDVRLGGALRQSSAAEVELGHSKQSQQEANNGGENSGSAVEPGDGLEKLLSVLLDDLDGDDWAEAAPLPGRDRGTGDGEAVADRPGTRAHHVLAQAMVVGAACARSWRSD